MDKEDKKGKLKPFLFLSLGAEVTGSVAAAALLGYFLDDWLGISPVFLIVLVIASTVAVFWRLIRVLRMFDRDKE